MRVLVAEDERDISAFVRRGLAQAGYVVTLEDDDQRGLQRALTAESDLIILDGMLPRLSGLEVLRRLRERQVRTPVLLLTARDEIADRIEGLDAGDCTRSPWTCRPADRGGCRPAAPWLLLKPP